MAENKPQARSAAMKAWPHAPEDYAPEFAGKVVRGFLEALFADRGYGTTDMGGIAGSVLAHQRSSLQSLSGFFLSQFLRCQPTQFLVDRR